MYKFFVYENQINNEIINIIDNDVNHIRNVLRLEIGEEIEICNIENGINYMCKILKLDNKIVKCQIVYTLEKTNEPNVYLHIFQGIPKQEKMELIIQKTTELGVSEITPLIMNRCIVKLDDKIASKKILRWQKIAEASAKQSKRDKIPKVNLPINIKNIYSKIANYDIVLVAYENEQNNSIKKVLQEVSNKNNLKIAIIIGPEGGIEQTELNELISNNVQVVSLGKRILRTETAPIVMASAIMYEFDEM